MKRNIATLLSVATLLLIAACDTGSDVERNGYIPRPPNAYELDIVAVDLVNKDSGAAVSVSGLPAAGGTLTGD